MSMHDAAQLNAKQLQHILGSVSINDARDPTEGMEQNDQIDYYAKIHAVLPLIEKEIQFLTAAQVEFMARRAETEQQVMFGRGCINFADILLDRFQQLASRHEKPVEETDDTSPTHRVPL